MSIFSIKLSVRHSVPSDPKITAAVVIALSFMYSAI